jgi:hypothetical protein
MGVGHDSKKKLCFVRSMQAHAWGGVVGVTGDVVNDGLWSRSVLRFRGIVLDTTVFQHALDELLKRLDKKYSNRVWQPCLTTVT